MFISFLSQFIRNAANRTRYSGVVLRQVIGILTGLIIVI
jgi:hypothetical protein